MADRKAGPGAGAVPRRPSFRLGGRARGGSIRLLAGLGGAGVLLLLVSGLFGTQAPRAGPSPGSGVGAPGTKGAAAVAAAAARATASATASGAGAAALPSDPVLRYERLLDENVALALDQVGGAAPVTVAITVASSPARILAQNTSSSQDRQTSGAAMQSSEQDALAYARGQVPVMTSESAPRVVGALIVARGAADAMVRAELTQAVETLLGLGANQVIVLPGR